MTKVLCMRQTITITNGPISHDALNMHSLANVKSIINRMKILKKDQEISLSLISTVFCWVFSY